MPVQMRTILEVADNSGAKKLACILPLGGSTGLKAGLGDIITASVKEAAPDGAVKKGAVVKCVIVRTRKETRRKDGSYIRFDSNAAVLVNDDNEPVTRVYPSGTCPRCGATWVGRPGARPRGVRRGRAVVRS